MLTHRYPTQHNTTNNPARTEFHNSARGVCVLDHSTARSQRRCFERSIYVNVILRGKPAEYYVNILIIFYYVLTSVLIACLLLFFGILPYRTNH